MATAKWRGSPGRREPASGVAGWLLRLLAVAGCCWLPLLGGKTATAAAGCCWLLQLAGPGSRGISNRSAAHSHLPVSATTPASYSRRDGLATRQAQQHRQICGTHEPGVVIGPLRVGHQLAAGTQFIVALDRQDGVDVEPVTTPPPAITRQSRLAGIRSPQQRPQAAPRAAAS